MNPLALFLTRVSSSKIDLKKNYIFFFAEYCTVPEYRSKSRIVARIEFPYMKLYKIIEVAVRVGTMGTLIRDDLGFSPVVSANHFELGSCVTLPRSFKIVPAELTTPSDIF
jgi:hypothetical protein